MKTKRVFWIFLLFLVFFATACSSIALADPPAPVGTATPQLIMVASQQTATPFRPVAITPTTPPPPTATPVPTVTPTHTATPAPTATATWSFNQAGTVVAPILLYHHIADISPASRYYVSPADFREQMQTLYDWGYTTITPSQLIQVLVHGGELPPRPILITFDDGNLNVYENAFPVMKELGFVGAFYIVANRLEAKGFVNATQLAEMAAAGWEIGSHGMSHADLTQIHGLARTEIMQSRLDLEAAIGVKVQSLAYPYGLTDGVVSQNAQDYGYTNGMGLGSSVIHTWGSMYYLSRREVHGDMDLAAFEALLPWTGSLEYIATGPIQLTATPSP